MTSTFFDERRRLRAPLVYILGVIGALIVALLLIVPTLRAAVLTGDSLSQLRNLQLKSSRAITRR